jgi:hypothetical protein
MSLILVEMLNCFLHPLFHSLQLQRQHDNSGYLKQNLLEQKYQCHQRSYPVYPKSDNEALLMSTSVSLLLYRLRPIARSHVLHITAVSDRTAGRYYSYTNEMHSLGLRN